MQSQGLISTPEEGPPAAVAASTSDMNSQHSGVPICETCTTTISPEILRGVEINCTRRRFGYMWRLCAGGRRQESLHATARGNVRL